MDQPEKIDKKDPAELTQEGFHVAVQCIKDAIEDFDGATAAEVLDTLMNYKFNDDVLEIITETKGYVNQFSFDHAKEKWVGMDQQLIDFADEIKEGEECQK